MTRNRFGNVPFLAAAALFCFILPESAAMAQNDADLGYHASGQQAPPVPVIVSSNFKDDHLQLIWLNSANPVVAQYVVYRLENYDPQNTLKPIGSVVRNQSTPVRVIYNDNTIEPGHVYTYFVTAKDSFGNQSGNSKMTSKTMPKEFRHKH